jgi:hypothetical protein
MSEFAAELARLMAARGVGVRELARTVPCNPATSPTCEAGRPGHPRSWLRPLMSGWPRAGLCAP